MTDNSLKKLLTSRLNLSRRNFLKQLTATGSTLSATSLIELAAAPSAHACEDNPTDDELTRVITSCAHNCGGRHVLVAHKRGDVIVRLSTDDGSLEGEAYGTDSDQQPQLRACLRGRSYRNRVYSPDRLLYPMIRAGARGEGKFRRASWDEALDFVAAEMQRLKSDYGPTAILDQGYAGAGYGVLHQSNQNNGLLSRFLSMFGCRTKSWSVPSNQGANFSSKLTFGTTIDGNEDEAFAHAQLIILWGWNPAYTFHGSNICYHLRMAKQRGCRFVIIDPQYTDSASAYNAWWIPIRPNTDAALLAAMAHYIFTNNLQDQHFIDRFCVGMDNSTMPPEFADHESFKDYILGTRDDQPKSPSWAAPICGVSAEQIERLADLYANTKPAALKASWAPGRTAYGEQYHRMAAAVQALTGNIGISGGCSEGVGATWRAQRRAGPIDKYLDRPFAAIKSDRWAYCVLNYPNVQPQDIGLAPRKDKYDGVIPDIRGIFWQGSNWLNQLPNINQSIKAINKLELIVCMDSTITSSGLWADVLLPVTTHFERHDVATPWIKGRYFIHRPKVIEPLGESKTDLQIFTALAERLGFAKKYNPPASKEYFHSNDAIDDMYLSLWWNKHVMKALDVPLTWQGFKQRGLYRFTSKQPMVAFTDQIQKNKPFRTPSGKIEIFSARIAQVKDWQRTSYGAPIPAIPKWIEPWEWLGAVQAKEYPFHLISPHPRWRTHSIFYTMPWLRETYEHEITINADDAHRLDIQTGSVVEVWNQRGRLILPAYVTERCMPGVVVIHEGAWFNQDSDGVDCGGNPDILTADIPSPSGALAFNTVLCNIRKTKRLPQSGWNKVVVVDKSKTQTQLHKQTSDKKKG